MGLVAAGVNGIKLEDNDEVVGAEIFPAEGEVFLLASDGKAKRVDQKEFPAQGRYGKGVRVWVLPKKITLAGAVSGKPNHMATIHLSKGAPKSTRLDAAAVRKRAATKGDLIVEVKPGESVTGVAVGWTVERYVKKVVEAEKEEKPAKAKKEGKAPSPKGKKETKPSPKPKQAPAKKAAKAKPAAKKKK
jgi:DNA gyrase subunit A